MVFIGTYNYIEFSQKFVYKNMRGIMIRFGEKDFTLYGEINTPVIVEIINFSFYMFEMK